MRDNHHEWQPLCSQNLLQYVALQDEHLVIDSTCSTLDEYLIQAPDIASPPRQCPEFAFGISDAGIQFHSYYCRSVDLTRQVLACGEWEYIGGRERTYRIGHSWTSHESIAHAKGFLLRMRDHYGTGPVRREVAMWNPRVRSLAMAFRTAGILDRETSPFFHAAFQRHGWRGDWLITDEVLVSGRSNDTLRFRRYLLDHGAHEQSTDCFTNVPDTLVLDALKLAPPA